jgi:L-asparagine transporter-like permease
MRSKFLSTTITTVIVIVLVLAALTFMDNNTSRNIYAGIILLCCLFVFAIALSLRQPSEKREPAAYKAG